MEDKPKFTAEKIQWKLICESNFSEIIEDYGDNPASLDESLTELIQTKSDVPQLLNDMLYYITEAEGIEKSIGDEIILLQARKKRFKQRSENLRNFLKTLFDRHELTKIETPFGTIDKVVRNASKVHVVDEGALLMTHPHLYIRQEPKLDKAALKQLLDGGEKIDGVELIDIVTIQIRK